MAVPAGTAQSAPQVTKIELGPRTVDGVRIQVPPGPRGEVGFWLGSAGVQVIPHDQGTFIVTDDDVIPLTLEDYWSSGSWEVHAYNTGTYAHTLTFWFLLSYVGTNAGASQPLTQDQLGAAGDVGSAPPSLPTLPTLPTLPLPNLPPLPGLGPPGGITPTQPAASTLAMEEEDMTGPVAFVNPFNGQQHKFQVRSGATGIEHWWQSNAPGSPWNGPEVLPNTAGKVATGAAIYASVYSVPGQIQVWVPLADNSGAYHAWQASGSGTWNNEAQ